MKEKFKNKKSNLTDFLRYSEGKMTDKERNAFEKELQKDPFVEEAAEGLAGFTPDEINRDLADMGKLLKKRVSGRQKFFYYRIAASVAVLMVIASLFYVIEKNKSVREPGQIAANQVTLDIPESKALTEPPAEKRKPEISEYSPVEAKTESPVRQAVRENAAAVSREIPKNFQARGEIISSEDNLPIPGASINLKGTTSGVLTDTRGKFSITIPDEKQPILVAQYIGMEPKEFRATTDTEMVIKLSPSVRAMNEAVAVGYGAAKKSKAVQTGYSPPEPETGMKNFYNYIEKNIKSPGTLSAGQKAIVIVSFTVRSTGAIDSLKIIRSPGTEFSQEALRLIREGPSWKPAVSDGEKTDDEVRVRIVFK